MSDTFDRLSQRKLFPQQSQEREWGTIVVEGLDPFASFTQHTCLIGIDGRLVGVLYPRGPVAKIDVLAGDHEVTVRLGPDFSEPLSIRIEAGGRIDLICGMKPEWKRRQMQIQRQVAVMCLISLAFIGLCWVAHPLLQGLVTEAIFRFDFQGGFASLCNKLVLTRIGTIAFLETLLVFTFFGMFEWNQRNSKRLRAEIGPRCYLKFKDL
jgi:hypothetical protein